MRAPIWPDPLADEGLDEVTFAILPTGGWLEGGVLAEAEDLNRPLLARPVRADAESSQRPLRIGGGAELRTAADEGAGPPSVR